MQYSEVKEIFDKSTLANACLVTGKNPDDIIKSYLKNQGQIELWNRCHREWGTLTNVISKEMDHSYALTLEWDSHKENRNGSSERTARTQFMNKNEENENKIRKWKSYIGDNCCFYVSYVENKEDGSVYRTLLDVELADY